MGYRLAMAAASAEIFIFLMQTAASRGKPSTSLAGVRLDRGAE